MVNSFEHSVEDLALIERLLHVDKSRLETISRLLAQDVDRVEAIDSLVAQDLERIEIISRLIEQDTVRVVTIENQMAQDNIQRATIKRLADQGVGYAGVIRRLMAHDIERATSIGSLLAQDESRVANIQHLSSTVERLIAQDSERVETIHRLLESINSLTSRLTSMDGISVTGRNLGFLSEPTFEAAWSKALQGNVEGWPAGVPDIRWRAHIALWAARHGMMLEGDFVECGVHTGIYSLVICHALNFASVPRQFFLFDTFNGIPLEGVADAELGRVNAANTAYYTDVFAFATRNFAPFPNAKLIQGVLPGALETTSIEKIAYLSIDLNNAAAEHGVITALWDKLVPGAVVLIDDYAWATCEPQYEMWNAFAAEKRLHIATLPTGQGLLLKPTE